MLFFNVPDKKLLMQITLKDGWLWYLLFYSKILKGFIPDHITTDFNQKNIFLNESAYYYYHCIYFLNTIISFYYYLVTYTEDQMISSLNTPTLVSIHP